MELNTRCRQPLATLGYQKAQRRPQWPLKIKIMRSLAFLLFLASANWASAQTLPSPEGDILLVITGALSNTNVEKEAHFDKLMLESLPSIEFSTHTPWAEGLQHFSGVRLSVLFDYIGAAPETIIAHGLDDYKFTITELNTDQYPVIIAYQHNGSAISVRKLGPLRIMFPFDDFPELMTPKNESSAVWQLVKMELQ